MNAVTRFNRTRFLLVALIVLVLASACAPTRIGTAWPSLGNVTLQDQSYVMVTYNNWAIVLDPSTGKVAELVDANGTVRTDDQGQPRRWEIDGNANGLGSQFYSQPVMRQADEQAQWVLPTHSLKLLLVDPDTARIDNPIGETMSGPIISNVAEDETQYYIGFDTRDVIALDKEALTVNWRYVTTSGIWGSPVVVDNVVYFATIDHNVFAVNAADGTLLWEKPTNTGGLIGAAPLVVDGFLYVGTTLDTLVKIDITNGAVSAELKLRNWVWSTPTAGDDGLLYVADLSGWVYGIDPTDMIIVWETLAGERGIRPSPLVTETHIIVASRDGRVHWLNRDGTKAFEREIEGRPEILGNLLYVPANEEAGINEPLVLVSSLNMSHLVVAFAEQSGTQRWMYAR